MTNVQLIAKLKILITLSIEYQQVKSRTQVISFFFWGGDIIINIPGKSQKPKAKDQKLYLTNQQLERKGNLVFIRKLNL